MRGHFPHAFSRIALVLTMSAGLAACATSPSRLSIDTMRPAPPPVSAREMQLGAPVEAPVGYVSLCMRSPVDCVQADTPQTRASAVLQAQAIARARWQRVIELAASRGLIEASPPVPASIGAPPAMAQATTGQISTAQITTEAAQPSTLEAALAGPAQAALALTQAPVLAPAAAEAPAPSDRKVALDAPTWTKLRQINAYVNRAIRPASDLEVYGARDWWVAPLSSGLAPYGDCKDYALEKRRELIAAGVPSRALSIALVRTTWGESHAVLVVATTDGDVVLDNLSGEIKGWDRTPYAWEARQSPDDPLVWLAVADKLARPLRHAEFAFADERRAFQR